MPAQYTVRIDKEGAYFHIYNSGFAGKIIFKDKQDYDVFLGYLHDYLTSPVDRDHLKKTFTVKGHIFQGVPHLTKNYFNKIDLIAYNLRPDHFHLLIRQLAPGSVERFIRSLCTRYSMHFNKRYQNSGSLFRGPYKSIQIDGISPLTQLTRYLHRDTQADIKHLGDEYSSYPEYLGKRQTLWVKPNAVLSVFNHSENPVFRGRDGYKNFVEKYEPEQKDIELLEGIILEKEFEHLVGSNPILARNDPPEEPQSRLPQFGTAIAIFILLFALGFRNVWISSVKATNSTISVPPPAATPAVSAAEDEQPKIMLAITINDGAESVNIRESPTLNSKKVGEAKDGDTFEFVAINSGWYGVKLADGSTGYIWSKYVEIIEETKI